MGLIVVGTNHKYSPIALRERIFFSKKRLRDALDFLRERGVLKGAVVVSTCNRVEIYGSAEDPDMGIKDIEGFISRYHEIDKKAVFPHLYVYKDEEALKHLIRVASGSDSLIVGETQILGQVKFAFSETKSAGFIDDLLREAFYSAISFAKRIQRDTGISEGRLSIGSVAIDFIKERLGTLTAKKVLIIGLGKVTELVIKYLKKERPDVVFVSNRTFGGAQQLAGEIGARAIRFDELKEFLKEADAVITATASPHFIIKKETVEKTNRPRLLILDLALPRDVDPRVKEIEGVELFCLEDLDTAVKKNIEKKAEEAKRVESIIDIEVERLWSGLTRLELERALLP